MIYVAKFVFQTDGGLKTGLDVIKAAILGAESFGFGSTPMIALVVNIFTYLSLKQLCDGCCDSTRSSFAQPLYWRTKMLINFFKFIAEETREWLAALGVSVTQSLIGPCRFVEV